MVLKLQKYMLRSLARLFKLRKLLSSRLRRQSEIRRTLKNSLYGDIWAQVANNLGGSIEQLPGGFFRISIGDTSTFVRGAEVRLDDHLTLKLVGNKPLVYQLLVDMNFRCVPDYCTYNLDTISSAMDFLNAAPGLVVVKPAAGTGGGTGVVSGISDQRQLLGASVMATSYCKELLVEEYYLGDSYRLLYLDGLMIDAIKRRPPTVTGDGQSTIAALVERENRLRQEAAGWRSTSLLEKNSEMRAVLREQRLSFRQVLSAGQVVTLKHVVNQNRASENHRVYASVHPSFVSIGQDIVRALGIELAGVDVIAPDISMPADSQSFIINDINTTPGLHHHYLLDDTIPDPGIGEQIVRYILLDKPNV